MPNLKPYRDINEHQILNGTYAYEGPMPTSKGTIVKILSGWTPGETELVDLGSPGASYTNVVAQRVGLPSTVAPCNASGDNAIGLLLYDYRELDENNMPLRFDSAKQARMQCLISGQSAVILRAGQVIYSGVNGGRVPVVGVTAGAPAYLGTDGGVNVSGSLTNASVKRVGTFLSLPNAKGEVLIDFSF